jgi:hypothetical protein
VGRLHADDRQRVPQREFSAVAARPLAGCGRAISDQGLPRQTFAVMKSTTIIRSYQPKTQCTCPVPAMDAHHDAPVTIDGVEVVSKAPRKNGAMSARWLAIAIQVAMASSAMPACGCARLLGLTGHVPKRIVMNGYAQNPTSTNATTAPCPEDPGDQGHRDGHHEPVRGWP